MSCASSCSNSEISKRSVLFATFHADTCPSSGAGRQCVLGIRTAQEDQSEAFSLFDCKRIGVGKAKERLREVWGVVEGGGLLYLRTPNQLHEIQMYKIKTSFSYMSL